MSEPRKEINEEALEQHRRIISNLSSSGISNTVEQEFEKQVKGNEKEIKTYEGLCGVCNEPLIPGYAVRCTHSGCINLLFHQFCFGTHTLKSHQPKSVTVIIRETKKNNVWEYIDADLSQPNTLRMFNRIPTAEDRNVGKDKGEEVSIKYYGPNDDENVRMNASRPEIKIPENTIKATTSEEEQKASASRTKRSRKRS